MSNTRKIREFQRGSGKLTRPRSQWRGHARRGRPGADNSSALAQQMGASMAPILRALSRSLPAAAGRRGNSDSRRTS